MPSDISDHSELHLLAGGVELPEPYYWHGDRVARISTSYDVLDDPERDRPKPLTVLLPLDTALHLLDSIVSERLREWYRGHECCGTVRGTDLLAVCEAITTGSLKDRLSAHARIAEVRDGH